MLEAADRRTERGSSCRLIGQNCRRRQLPLSASAATNAPCARTVGYRFVNRSL